MRFSTIVASGLLGLALLSMGQARAAPLRLIYDGYLSADPNTLDTLNGTVLPSPTPFSVRAEFDSSQPNFFLCGITPCPGTAWYAPSRFTMGLQGRTYQVSRVQDDPLNGQAVVVFDKTSPFSDVGDPVSTRHYGVGFFSAANPKHIGVIGDWSYASPDMTIGTLAPTVFETFYGVGYNRGLIKLELSGVPYELILNDAFEYNGTDPLLIFTGKHASNPTIPDNFAVIVAVPEPEALAMLASALLLAGLLVPGMRLRR